ncbi:hypothetical protein SADUNF_Sadunf16G0173300 [Salix dunnii]|uniref:Reverse transcriptase Ty1/copia-type domain-containing protein n=1 Tax=Salix dunnii TaxID=1413687 RepID=A0A835JC74_9ROSI|nr:hypothetical protein SADUNF_Sadunf16G0173300 [Salix dunnii]
MFYKLHKSIYGLKQSPRAWHAKLSTVLEALGFKRSSADSSLYVQLKANDNLMVLIYVDDLIITAAATPLDSKLKLAINGEALETPSHYQKLVDKLIYLTITRPNIAFTVSLFSYQELAQATNNFKDEEKIGEGGFGGVYKGFLKEIDSFVAVKRVSRNSKQGIKEYAAELYGKGKLIEVVDLRLCGDFNKTQVERLMIVGLSCANADEHLRPSVQHSLHVFNFDAPLPILPSKMPVPSYFAPPLSSLSIMSYGSADSTRGMHESSSYVYNTNSSQITTSSSASSASAMLLHAG